MTTPVTQRDVAAECKVHPSTICLALNNSPSIPLATRQRIRAAARQLGYQPNAAARNLAFMRGDKNPAATMPLAWINQEPERGFWQHDPAGRAHWNGARRRAAELGYHLEEFGLHENGMSTGRLAQIIHARGIQGVVFPVLHTLDADLFQPAWNKFACISFNDHRSADWMDVVCPDYYHNTDRIITELNRRGFARIGLALTAGFDAATSGLVSSCYLRYTDNRHGSCRIPVCLLPEDAAEGGAQFRNWYRQHHPDVVVYRDVAVKTISVESGCDAAFVHLGGAMEECMPGINEQPGEIAAAAIERIADKIRRFERGIGHDSQCHLIKGRWCEGGLARVEAQAVA